MQTQQKRSPSQSRKSVVLGGLMLNNVDLGKLAPKLLRSMEFGRNWELSVVFLNLFAAYVNLDTLMLNFNGYLDMLKALKLLDPKDLKLKSKFAVLFKQKAKKQGTEYVVGSESLVDLLFQTYEVFVKIDEFNIIDIINNSKSVITRSFKEYALLSDSGVSFVIDTIISKEYFADYYQELEFCINRLVDMSRMPDLDSLNLDKIPKYYREYARFYKAVGIVPNFLSERGLWLILNAFLTNLISLRKGSGYIPGKVQRSDRDSEDSGEVGYQNTFFVETMLNLINKTQNEMMNIDNAELFRYIFQFSYGLISQWFKDKLLRPSIFKDQYAAFVFKKSISGFYKKELGGSEFSSPAKKSKSRSASPIISRTLQKKKLENALNLTGTEVLLIQKYQVVKNIEVDDLIE